MPIKNGSYLVVDDYESIRKLIRKELLIRGAAVVEEARDGEQAWEIARSQNFDAILSDWNMPKLNGIGLLAKVRNSQSMHRIPFMLITAEADKKLVEKAIELRVSDFLLKPFSINHLISRVENLSEEVVISERQIRALVDINESENFSNFVDSLPDLSTKNILVVDDIADNLAIISNALKGHFNIKAANNAEFARKIMANQTIDLILLDVMMPGENGYELCKWIKNQSNLKHIPIIFLTANDTPEEITQGLALGAIDYITKPAHPVVLLTRVKIHLENAVKNIANIRKSTLLENALSAQEASERMMRHDLKNPLTAAMIALEQNIGSVDDAKKMQGQTSTNLKRALNIVTNVLSIAQLENGTHILDWKKIKLKTFMEQIKEVINPIAFQRKIALEWTLPEKEVVLELDIRLAESVLTNLIKNATEAQEPGDIVTISYNGDEFYWKIVNSRPVPDTIKHKFFDKYVTFGKPGGTGLGTYSARLMAQTMKGGVHLSTSKKGTVITVQMGNTR